MIDNKYTLNEARKRKRKTKPTYDSISCTTGDIELNINRFNQAMGTAGLSTPSSSDSGGGLTEAKRYVRRYYVRPQNIFCSNKAEIIKTLIELGSANCSIYTLNNLGDEKDVSKLMNSDIIYYYDDGILYDKNRVKVMDYDLSIKKEENRKHLAKGDKSINKEFKDTYADRMTKATELEENLSIDTFADCDYDVIDAGYTNNNNEIIVTLNHTVSDIEDVANQLISCLEKNNIYIIDWTTNGSNVFIFEQTSENAFDLDFDDYNVFGEKLTEAKENLCCICGEVIDGYGNNPEPYMSADEGRCCDGCNLKFVVPLRSEMMKGE